jgi:hypothetical protein
MIDDLEKGGGDIVERRRRKISCFKPRERKSSEELKFCNQTPIYTPCMQVPK